MDVDKEFVMADAIILVKEKPFEDLLSVAASLGFNVDRQAAEIKHDLLMFAKKSPAQFIKMFDNPEVTMKAKIRMAIKYGIIDAARSGVRWKDSGTLIVSVPAENLSTCSCGSCSQRLGHLLSKSLIGSSKHRPYTPKGPSNRAAFSFLYICIMPASVKVVYETLKDLVNKDQQGFVTVSEFNNFAQLAQLRIFNRLFDTMKEGSRLEQCRVRSG